MPVPDLVAGAGMGDTFLVKYASSSGPVWANHLAPAGKARVTINPMLGSLVVSGSATGSPYGVAMQPYGGKGDIFAGTYAPQAGGVGFAKIFGGPGDESAHAVPLPDGSGKVVLGGVFQGML